jgi:hypothetical protein
VRRAALVRGTLVPLVALLLACEVEGPFMGITEQSGFIDPDTYAEDPAGQMAKAFDGETLGALPDGWTPNWVTESANWHVDERSGRVVLVHSGESNARHSIMWDEAGDLVNPDILVLTKVPGTFNSAQQWIAARASGGEGGETGYAFQVRNNQVRIARYNNGSLSTLGDHASVDFELDTDRWYWMRFQLDNWRLRGKIWPEGEPEPELWTIIRQDQVLTEAGGVGVGRFNTSTGDAYFAHFGVGSGGEPPPRP